MSSTKNVANARKITDHALERWSERMHPAKVDVGTAWANGITVNAPECDCDTAKLYPPKDALLIEKNGSIVTVLPADYDRLDTTDLVWCTNCDCATRLHRLSNECEWCESQAVMEFCNGNI